MLQLVLLYICLFPLQETTLRDLKDVLEPARKEYQLPAMGGAIVTSEGLIALGAVGVREAGKDVAVTVDDLWHLGSCTKSMTATMLAILVEKKVLSWETTVGEIFAKDYENLHEGLKNVTLVDLLTHRSGLRDDRKPDAEDYVPSPVMGTAKQRTRMVEAVLQRGPDAERGENFQYSNLGYVLAGAMAEKVTGKSWEELMRCELFTPLQMKSADFGPPGSLQKIDQPRGHSYRKGTFIGIGPSPLADNAAGMGPAGTVHCSLADWAKYISLHLRGVKEDTKILKKESFHKLHTPKPGEDYAMGWVEVELPNGGSKVLRHSGSNSLWLAVVRLVPQKGFAVLVTSNAASAEVGMGCNKVADQLIDLYLNEMKKD